jgi:hypothetical protein
VPLHCLIVPGISLATDFELAQYLLSLVNLSPDVLIGRFKQLENDVGRLRPYIKAESDKYRQALNAQHATLLAPTAGAAAVVALSTAFDQVV